MDVDDDIVAPAGGSELSRLQTQATVNPDEMKLLRSIATEDFKTRCPDAFREIAGLLSDADHLNSLNATPQELRDARQSINQGLAITIVLTSIRTSQKNARTTVITGVIPPNEHIERSVVDVSSGKGRAHLVYTYVPNTTVQCAAAIAYEQVKLKPEQIAVLKANKLMGSGSRRENNLVPKQLVLLCPGSRVQLTHYIPEAAPLTELMVDNQKLVRGMCVTFSGLTPNEFGETGDSGGIVFHCTNDIRLERFSDNPELDYEELLSLLVPTHEDFYSTALCFQMPLPHGLAWEPMYSTQSFSTSQVAAAVPSSSSSLHQKQTGPVVEEVDAEKPTTVAANQTDKEKRLPGELVPAVRPVFPVIPVNPTLFDQLVFSKLAHRMGSGTRFTWGSLVTQEDEGDWVYTKQANGTTPAVSNPIAKVEMMCRVNGEDDWLLHFDIRSDVLAAITGVVGSMAEKLARFILPYYTGQFPVATKTQPGPMKLASGKEVTTVTFYVNAVPMTRLPTTIAAAGFPLSRLAVLKTLMFLRRGDQGDPSANIKAITEQNPLTRYNDLTRRNEVINITQNDRYCLFAPSHMTELRATAKGDVPASELRRIKALVEADTKTCQLFSLDPKDYDFYLIIDQPKTPAIDQWIASTPIDTVHAVLERLLVMHMRPESLPPCLEELAKFVVNSGKFVKQLFAVEKQAVTRRVRGRTLSSELLQQLTASPEARRELPALTLLGGDPANKSPIAPHSNKRSQSRMTGQEGDAGNVARKLFGSKKDDAAGEDDDN